MKYYLGALLLLCSCIASDRWAVSHIEGRELGSSKLSYRSPDIVNGIDVEFLRVGKDLHTYLQVHSQSIPPLNDNPKEALVAFEVEGREISGIGFRHEGGQRVMLSSTFEQQLIAALKEQKVVKLKLQGFQTVIDSTAFAERFEEMQVSPIRNPLQLPFKI